MRGLTSISEIFIHLLKGSMGRGDQTLLPEVFYKLAVLENFAIFTQKHLRWSLLLKLQANTCVFMWILQYFMNTYFWEYLRTSASWTSKSQMENFFSGIFFKCGTIQIHVLDCSSRKCPFFIYLCLGILYSLNLIKLSHQQSKLFPSSMFCNHSWLLLFCTYVNSLFIFTFFCHDIDVFGSKIRWS